MTALVATDLDGTVMFTVKRPPPGLVLVDEVGSACMTTTTAAGWERLAATGSLVPVTTRSIPQYRRLALPGPPVRYAMVCNGARLLVDGEIDAQWHHRVRRDIAASAAGFHAVWQQAICWHANRGFRTLRAVEEFFIYLTVVRSEGWLTEFAAEAQDWAAPLGWHASLQGRKLYLVPAVLDKSVAVAQLATRLSADEVIAGGDSGLDAAMLRAARAAIRPRHGELHRIGFTAPNCQVTAEQGPVAGDEIVGWYARQIGMG